MRVSRRLTAIGILAGAGWFLSPTGPAAADEPVPTIETIVKAWKDRQAKVERARFEFSATRTFHKGATDYLAAIGGGKVTDVPNPPQDHRVKGRARLGVDGARLRYAMDMDEWDPVTRALYPEHYEDAFDGEVFRSLRNPQSPASYPVGQIRPAKKSPSATQFSLLPLLTAVRGDPAGMIAELASYKVSPDTIQVGTRPCVELVRELPARGRREVLYLDRQRGYVLVRKMTLQNDKPTWQLDVTHSEDRTAGWVPKAWEFVVRSPDATVIVGSGSRSVTGYELNPKFPADAFDLKFPPGTVVRDLTSGKAVDSVIQEDGTSRPVRR